MPNIEETLRATLSSIANKTEQASREIHDATIELKMAVESSSNGLITILLEKKKESEKSTEYSLQVVSILDGEKRDLGNFSIPLTGYPISFVSIAGIVNGIKDNTELLKLFDSFVSNPNSPLIVYLSYSLRKRTGM